MTGDGGDTALDRQLIERMRQGDGEALDALLKRIETGAHRTVQRSLGKRLRADARPSDLLQDAYLEVVRCAPSFRGETVAEFARWVGQIIVNCARHRHRSLRTDKRSAPSRPSGLRQLLEARPLPVDSPSAPARHNEFLTRYAGAMDRLNPVQRAVVQAVVLDGRAVDEVARELGRSPSAIHSLLARARAVLALRLGDDRPA
ncbi:MAG: sigma-70 family RNA polymerase sigma factor [Planctomycetota bacterium]